MDLKITQNKKNEVLKRSEIVAEFDQKTIPTREDIRKNIAAKLNTKTGLVIVDNIDVNYGTSKGNVIIRVYSNDNDLKETESKHILERNKEKEVPKEESTTSTEATEEKKEVIEEEASDVAEQASEEKKE